MANLVGRLDKGAPDIMVADNAEFERQAGLSGIADCRWNTRIRHWHHKLRVAWRFPGKFGADRLTRLIDALALHQAIGPGKINIVEHAKALGRALKGREAGHHAVLHKDHFTRLDIAHQIGTYNIEGHRFRGQNIGVFQSAKDERADAVRIAYADHGMFSQRD